MPPHSSHPISSLRREHASMGTLHHDLCRMLYLPTPLTTDTRPPAKLLSQLSRYPNPALWGFPIDQDHIAAEFRKTVPPGLVEHDRLSRLQIHCRQYFSGLAVQCNDIWDSPTTGVRNVRSKGKPKLIMSIVKCTRPDDRFLPPPDKIEEMRKIVVALGFTGEPGWFTGKDIGWSKNVAQQIPFPLSHLSLACLRGFPGALFYKF